MRRRSVLKKPVRPARKLRLEPLEPRAMLAAADYQVSNIACDDTNCHLVPIDEASLPRTPSQDPSFTTIVPPDYVPTSQPSLPLDLDTPEQRTVPAAPPLHLRLPFGTLSAAVVTGAALLDDGTLRLVGFRHALDYRPTLFRIQSTISFRPMVWDLNEAGEIIGQTQLSLPANYVKGELLEVSPDGRWLSGMTYSTEHGPGRPTVWNAARPDEPIVVGFSADTTFEPFYIHSLANDGTAVLSARADDGLNWASYAWHPNGDQQRLLSLYADEPAAKYHELHAYATRISADGAVIVGISGQHDESRRATAWKASAFSPIALRALGGPSEAHAVSDDGLVIGGHVMADQSNQPAVWVDGELSVLRDEHGQATFGGIEYVFNGVGGLARDWIALGGAAREPAIAFSSDGVIRSLKSWLNDHYALELTGEQVLLGAFYRDSTLYVLTCSPVSTFTTSDWQSRSSARPAFT
jgi:hypothetical protein